MTKNSTAVRWVSWGLPVLAYVICFFHSLAMGVIRENLIGEFGISEVGFSQISAAYFYVYLLMQIPSGILADTVGPRLTVAAGTLLSVVGSLVFGFAGSVAGLFVGRLLIGLGVSVIFISIIKLQSIWFKPDQFSTMSGLTCFIGTMGGVLAQTPLALLIGFIGWRGAFKLVALVSVILSLLIYVFVKDRNTSALSDTKDEKVQIWVATKSILSNWRTWPPFLLYAGFYGSFVVISGLWGTSYMSDVYGISMVDGSKFISMVVLGSAFGAIGIGFLSDRIRKRKLPTVLYSILYLALWVGMVYGNGGKLPISIMMAYMFTMGFFSQGFVLSWSVGKEVNDARYVGMAASIINIGGFLGSIAVPALTAKALVSWQTYQRAFAAIVVVAVLTLVFSLLMKETDCKSSTP